MSGPDAAAGAARDRHAMRYRALACDYDGTLARDGRVEPATLAALERFRAAGGRLLLVTGRCCDDLYTVFPQAGRFDRIVAENGALLLSPAEGRRRLLGPPPPAPWVAALRAAGVEPLALGEVIAATLAPHAALVADAIRQWGLPLQISRNKEAVMVLPAGVDKASGLAAALEELGLEAAATVGVGDAENDLPFLRQCGLAVAVANALDEVKAQVDRVTLGEDGTGVRELIGGLLDGG